MNDDWYDDDSESMRERRVVRRAIPEHVYYGTDEEDEPERYWTVRRVIFVLLVLLTLLAFLAYSFSFLLEQPAIPTPIPTPRPLFRV